MFGHLEQYFHRFGHVLYKVLEQFLVRPFHKEHKNIGDHYFHCFVVIIIEEVEHDSRQYYVVFFVYFVNHFLDQLSVGNSNQLLVHVNVVH